MQAVPLKNEFSFGQTQANLFGSKVLPNLQTSQSMAVMFQKLGNTHATHLFPSNLGLSSGQNTHFCLVRS